MKRSLLFSFLLLAGQAHAQSRDTALEAGIRYAVTEANAPPGSCGCFFLQGGGMDVALPIAPRLRAVVDVTGTTVSRVPQSPRGLSEITLLAGPRYSQQVARLRVNVQALFGAVRGFDSDFTVTPTTHADTSTNFAMSLGGSADLPVTHSLLLRPVQLEYLQTNLPNDAGNRQRNIRFGAGLVLRFHLPSTQR